MKETIKRSEFEKIKLDIKEMERELKYLDPLNLADANLISSYRKKLKFYIDLLESCKPRKKVLRLIKS